MFIPRKNLNQMTKGSKLSLNSLVLWITQVLERCKQNVLPVSFFLQFVGSFCFDLFWVHILRCSGVTLESSLKKSLLDSVGGPHGMPGIIPRFTLCKASTVASLYYRSGSCSYFLTICRYWNILKVIKRKRYLMTHWNWVCYLWFRVF